MKKKKVKLTAKDFITDDDTPYGLSEIFDK